MAKLKGLEKASTEELTAFLDELENAENDLTMKLTRKKKPKLRPKTEREKAEEATEVRVDEEENGSFAGYRRASAESDR